MPATITLGHPSRTSGTRITVSLQCQYQRRMYILEPSHVAAVGWNAHSCRTPSFRRRVKPSYFAAVDQTKILPGPSFPAFCILYSQSPVPSPIP